MSIRPARAAYTPHRFRTLPVPIVCAALWLVTVWLDWPGHYSLDSIVQLAEGMTGFYASFNPPGMSVLLAWVSRWGGHGAFMALDAALYFAALALVLRDGGPGWRRRWPVLLLAGAVALGPVTLIYNGTVWKDVFCANLLLLAFALVTTRRDAPPWAVIGASMLLAAMATLVRQQGAIAALVLVVATAWAIDRNTVHVPARMRGLRLLQVGALWIGWVLALSWLVASQQTETPPGGKGWRVAARFDIAGMVVHARHPDAVLRQFGIDADAAVRAARQSYTPERVDTLAAFNATLVGVKSQMLPLWWALFRAEPLSLLEHKAAAAAQLLGNRLDGRCLPAHVGVSSDALDILRRNMPYTFPPGFLPAAPRHTDLLYRYRQWGLAAFSGWPYALLLVAVLAAGLRTRNATASSLALAGLAYVGSFLVVGLACDFRYQYFGVAAAMLAALALWRRTPPGATP